MEGTLGAADCALLRGSAQEATLGRRPSRKRVSFGGELAKASSLGPGPLAPNPGGLVKGSRAHEASFGQLRLVRTRLVATRDRERRPIQPAGPRAHDTRCQGRCWIGVCPAPAREIAAGGARVGESRCLGPLVRKPLLESLRKGRFHPETTSGEGNFTATRVTSRYCEMRVSAFSHDDATPGLGRSRAVLADRSGLQR